MKMKTVLLFKFTDSMNSMPRSLRGYGSRVEHLSCGKWRETGWFNDRKERLSWGREERRKCHFWKVYNKVFATALDFLHLDSHAPGLTMSLL